MTPFSPYAFLSSAYPFSDWSTRQPFVLGLRKGTPTYFSFPHFLIIAHFDFSRAKRGAIVRPEPGKTKISIRLDNAVLEYFRSLVDTAGGGNYQTLINDALLEYVHRRSTLDVARQAVREELAPYGIARRSNTARQWTRRARR